MNIIQQNVARETIDENVELMRALKATSIKEFFKQFDYSKKSKHDITGFGKVDEILDNYGIHADARTRTFYYTIFKLSRIINKREKPDKQDYNLIKYLIENINCKLDVSDTDEHRIEGFPDLSIEKDTERYIEETTQEIDEDGFGFNTGIEGDF